MLILMHAKTSKNRLSGGVTSCLPDGRQVIARGMEGKYIFKEEYDKKELYTRLKELLEKSNVQIYAWSIMSNHFHKANNGVSA